MNTIIYFSPWILISIIPNILLMLYFDKDFDGSAFGTIGYSITKLIRSLI